MLMCFRQTSEDNLKNGSTFFYGDIRSRFSSGRTKSPLLENKGKDIFGVTLPWDEWEKSVQRIRMLGAKFLAEPVILMKGTPEEQAKFYLADPGNNVIEIEAYKTSPSRSALRANALRLNRNNIIHQATTTLLMLSL